MTPSYAQGFARCAAESKYPELWRGLVGAWCPFLGPTGWTLRDWSGHQNHGTLTDMDPATAWVSDRRWALEFDGIDDYIVSERNVGLSGDIEATLSVRVKFNSIGGFWYKAITAFGGINPGQGFAIFVGENRVTVGFFGGLSWAGYIVGAVATGEWYDLVATKIPGAIGPNTVALYINGNLQTLVFGGAGTPSIVDGKWYVGNDAGGEISNPAITCNACIYNRALSAEEIALLYREPYCMFEYRQPRSIFRMPGILPIMLQHDHFNGGAIL